jgi:hypothetical protein
MSNPKPKATKASRTIPEHVKRAVNARDNFTCRNCGVRTEFIHYDHIFPYDLGGPNTLENVQSLCPKCNTSKGNKIQCHHCRHWLSPEHSRCTQCGSRFPYSKRSQTLAGKLEDLFHRVGRAVVIGGGALILIALPAGFISVYRYFSRPSQSSDDSAQVQTLINKSFESAAHQPASFQIVVPPGASNARVVGGYKMTSGSGVSCYLLEQSQFQLMSSGTQNFQPVLAKQRIASARFRQPLKTGTYYLLFVPESGDGTPVTVAAEFYLKYD